MKRNIERRKFMNSKFKEESGSKIWKKKEEENRKLCNWFMVD